MKSIGWGTWIRTKTNGVRVRRSTVKLFPSKDDNQYLAINASEQITLIGCGLHLAIPEYERKPF